MASSMRKRAPCLSPHAPAACDCDAARHGWPRARPRPAARFTPRVRRRSLMTGNQHRQSTNTVNNAQHDACACAAAPHSDRRTNRTTRLVADQTCLRPSALRIGRSVLLNAYEI